MNVIGVAVLEDFKCLVCAETVTDQRPFLVTHLFSGLRVEYSLQPLEADFGVRVARWNTPSWGGVGCVV
jgi:hypothetical protein